MRNPALAWIAIIVGAFVGGCGGPEGSSEFSCGNGVIDPGETCDDGNRLDGDACPENCILKTSFVVRTNSCPGLDRLVISPSRVSIGQTLSIDAEASDPEGGPVYFDFTGTGGLIEQRKQSGFATFTCGYSGPHVITLWMFDELGCVAHRDATVFCD